MGEISPSQTLVKKWTGDPLHDPIMLVLDVQTPTMWVLRISDEVTMKTLHVPALDAVQSIKFADKKRGL